MIQYYNNKVIKKIIIIFLFLIGITFLFIYLNQKDVFNDRKFYVTYESNELEYKKVEVIGNKVAKPEEPVRDGYIFIDWYYNDSPFDFDSEIENDIVLKAVWVKKEIKNEEDIKSAISVEETISTKNIVVSKDNVKPVISKISVIETSKSFITNVVANDNKTLSHNLKIKYSLDGKNYQDSNVFDELLHDKNYTMSVKVIDEAGNFAIESNVVRTKKVDTPEIESITPMNITQKDVEVIFKDNSNYILEYSLDGKNYNKYNNKIIITDNVTLYYRYTDGFNFSRIGVKVINNIDKESPKSFIPEINKTTKSIKIKANTTDNYSSSDKLVYKYSIDGKNYQNSNVFNNLIRNNLYDIYVKVIDEALNERIVKTSVKTNEYEIPIIESVSPTIMTRDKVSIKIEKNTDYKLEYSLDGEYYYDFYDYTGNNEYIVYNNGTYYFRYSIGNKHGESISVSVNNIDNEPPEWNNPIITHDETSIRISEKATDNYTAEEDLIYEYSINNRDYQSSNVFTGLTLGNTYRIGIKVTDEVNNVLYFSISYKMSYSLVNTLLESNGGKEFIEAKSNPDFTAKYPEKTKYIDSNLFYTISNTDSLTYRPILRNFCDNYFTYSSKYTFNEETGKYTLLNPKTCKYKDCYKTNLLNNYFIIGTGQKNNVLSNYTEIDSISKIYNSIAYYYPSDNTCNYTAKSMTAIEDYDRNEKGMYATQDDYGISYYFRGAADNNWVKFANMYWKIIRINGDESIRLIYAGSKSPKGNVSYELKSILDKYINNENNNTEFSMTYEFANNNELESVGYMYSDGQLHGTDKDSKAKVIIDTWFEKKLKNYQKYLSDTLFCNDRSAYNDVYGNEIYDGTSENIYFGSYIRNVTNNSPSLKCPNKVDSFTVDDTVKGNGALKYPIGLLTLDEIIFAGIGYSQKVPNNYLSVPSINNRQTDWTLTPFSKKYYLNMASLNNDIINYNYVESTLSIRPVISLKADTKVIGRGTLDSPYEIAEYRD